MKGKDFAIKYAKGRHLRPHELREFLDEMFMISKSICELNNDDNGLMRKIIDPILDAAEDVYYSSLMTEEMRRLATMDFVIHHLGEVLNDAHKRGLWDPSRPTDKKVVIVRAI